MTPLTIALVSGAVAMLSAAAIIWASVLLSKRMAEIAKDNGYYDGWQACHKLYKSKRDTRGRFVSPRPMAQEGAEML